MLVVAKTCHGESMHMVAHASEWDVEGRLPSIATDPNDNTIHVDADQPGITYPKVLGRINMAAKSKPGVEEAILMAVMEEASVRINYTLSL
ncbi:hypothetical protein Tco_1192442 [Tanacetum coccineum]